MRAGLLNNILEIFRYEDVQSRSGELSKKRTFICNVRAALVKQSGNYKVSANEEQDTVTLVFECWADSRIQDIDLVSYNGQEFRIFLIEKTTQSRSMKLYCKKINK